jgi:hypothetical protein
MATIVKSKSLKENGEKTSVHNNHVSGRDHEDDTGVVSSYLEEEHGEMGAVDDETESDLGDPPTPATLEDFRPHPFVFLNTHHHLNPELSYSDLGYRYQSGLNSNHHMESTAERPKQSAKYNNNSSSSIRSRSKTYQMPLTINYPSLGSAPPLSADATEDDTDTDDDDIISLSGESDVASEAASYNPRRRRARIRHGQKLLGGSTRQRHRRAQSTDSERGIAVGNNIVVIAVEEEEDQGCAHCAKPSPDQYLGYVTHYSCCDRRSHTICVVSNPTARDLLLGKFEGAPDGETGCSVENIVKNNIRTPCLSCLRPANLIAHQELLDAYAKFFESLAQPEPHTDSNTKNSTATQAIERDKRPADAEQRKSKHVGGSGLFNRLFGKAQPAVDGYENHGDNSSSSDNNSDDSDDDDGTSAVVSIRELLAQGRSLESVAAEYKLNRIDDEYEIDWERMQFTKETLLSLGSEDLLFYMRNYRVHPYRLRWKFDITLADLWVNDEAQIRAVRDYARHHHMKAGTEDLCAHFRLLTPTKLALMGFDTHHLIQMGFTKDGFLRFPAFTLQDWTRTLGFAKPHWWLLKFSKADFLDHITDDAPIGRGWNFMNLRREWQLDIVDLQTMGMVDDENLLSQLRDTSDHHHHHHRHTTEEVVPLMNAPRGRRPPMRNPGPQWRTGGGGQRSALARKYGV